MLMFGRRGTDIGRLRPVEVVQLYEKNGLLFLETDTGDAGWGMTLEQAANKLRETTPGKIYLDTADFLLISDLDDQETEALKGILKPSIRLCETEGRVDPARAVQYLRIHKPEQRLHEWTAAKHPQQLTISNGKLMLELF